MTGEAGWEHLSWPQSSTWLPQLLKLCMTDTCPSGFGPSRPEAKQLWCISNRAGTVPVQLHPLSLVLGGLL